MANKGYVASDSEQQLMRQMLPDELLHVLLECFKHRNEYIRSPEYLAGITEKQWSVAEAILMGRVCYCHSCYALFAENKPQCPSCGGPMADLRDGSSLATGLPFGLDDHIDKEEG